MSKLLEERQRRQSELSKRESNTNLEVIELIKSVLKHLPQCDLIMMSLCSSITINNEINRIKSLRKLFSDLLYMISFGYR